MNSRSKEGRVLPVRAHKSRSFRGTELSRVDLNELAAYDSTMIFSIAAGISSWAKAGLHERRNRVTSIFMKRAFRCSGGSQAATESLLPQALCAEHLFRHQLDGYIGAGDRTAREGR